MMMTDSKTATERLREILDALGVRYEKSEDDTTIYYDEGKRYTYSVNPESGWAQLFGYHLTPEQAIAATLGAHSKPQSKTSGSLSDDGGSLSDATLVSGTLTAEQVRGAVKLNSTFDYGDIGEYVSRERWQAIADELNATLGSGECEFKPFAHQDANKEGLDGVCSACSAYMHEQFSFCPNCGKAVKR